MHLHESPLANIMAQTLQPRFSYSHEKGCASHVAQRNTKVCVVYNREKCRTPAPDINGNAIKIALLLCLRLEPVSGNQGGVTVEWNFCSQLLSWRGRHRLMKSQRFEVISTFNWNPFALMALLLFYFSEDQNEVQGGVSLPLFCGGMNRKTFKITKRDTSSELTSVHVHACFFGQPVAYPYKTEGKEGRSTIHLYLCFACS